MPARHSHRLELVVSSSRAGWWDRAACIDVPSAVFFPSVTEEIALAGAKRYCDRCPVAEDCMTDALAYDDVGIRAGTTTEQRRALSKTRKAQQAS